MPIYQTSVWICDYCGVIDSVTEEVSEWSSNTVTPPAEGWEVLETGAEEKLACPGCLKQEVTNIEITDIVVTKVDDVSPVDVLTKKN